MSEHQTKEKTDVEQRTSDDNDNSIIILPEIEPLSWKFWQKKRYVLVLLVFFGLCNVYALRVNMSIAIVAMTKIQTIHYENGTTVEKQNFNWNSREKGLILSSFFYGYILTQLLGGYLSTKYSATMIFGGGILLTSIFTIFTPLAANYGFYVIFAIRMIEGFFEGVTFPSLIGIWANWAPPNERARINSLAFSGNYIGTLIAMPLCSVLAENFGWEYIFYAFGGLGVLWCLAWFLVVKNTPAQHKSISADECRYIQETIGFCATDKNIKPVPWKSIFMSVPVWAIVVVNFVENWGVYTMITQLPAFLIEALNYSLQMAGNLSGIPYFGMALLLPIAGFLSDYCTTKEYLTVTQTRKYSTCFSYLIQAICLLACAWLMDPVASIIFIIIGSSMGAFAYSGFCTNILDIAPQYGSVIIGLSNTFGTIPGIVSPTLTGFIVQNGTPDEWKIVFYIGAGIYVFGLVVYWIWCSAKVQPWGVVECEEQLSDKKTQKPRKSITYMSQ